MAYIKLNEILERKGKSRYWLEKETGLTFQTIANLIRNDAISIHFITLEKICIALECTPNDIIEINKPNK